MSIDLSLFRCTGIRVAIHHPNNGNCMKLVLERENEDVEVTIFDLPKDVSHKLLIAFSDDNTHIGPDARPVSPDESEAA